MLKRKTEPPTPPLPLHALEPHVRQMAAIAEILLGAAHSDGTVSWSERSAIAQVLTSFLDHRKLPEEVEIRFHAFDPATFDLEATCHSLELRTAEDRASLLALVSRVVDADAVLVAGEEHYLRRVAKAIGASDEELAPYLVCDTEEWGD